MVVMFCYFLLFWRTLVVMILMYSISHRIWTVFSANERWCYIVMLTLIGWVHTQNDPCVLLCFVLLWLFMWSVIGGFVTHMLQGCFTRSRGNDCSRLVIILPSHKSHNASDIYPTMHYFVTEMCTYVHISVTKWCIVGYGLVHCGICATGLNHNKT